MKFSTNHRHHYGCALCTASREERETMKAVGITWGSAQALQCKRNHLRRGMNLETVEKVLRMMHPVLMANLKVDRWTGRIKVVNLQLRWERRRGWGRKAAVLSRLRELEELGRRSRK